jgi:hypothetical protein
MLELKNRKHTPQAVLNLLWAIRNNDRFYFDTYGKLWLSEMIKESKKLKKPINKQQ